MKPRLLFLLFLPVSWAAMCPFDCDNGGECVEPGYCLCASGWRGTTCDEPRCEPDCLNGGVCVSPNNCACVQPYIGEQCEIDPNGTPAPSTAPSAAPSPPSPAPTPASQNDLVFIALDRDVSHVYYGADSAVFARFEWRALAFTRSPDSLGNVARRTPLYISIRAGATARQIGFDIDAPRYESGVVSLQAVLGGRNASADDVALLRDALSLEQLNVDMNLCLVKQLAKPIGVANAEVSTNSSEAVPPEALCLATLRAATAREIQELGSRAPERDELRWLCTENIDKELSAANAGFHCARTSRAQAGFTFIRKVDHGLTVELLASVKTDSPPLQWEPNALEVSAIAGSGCVLCVLMCVALVWLCHYRAERVVQKQRAAEVAARARQREQEERGRRLLRAMDTNAATMLRPFVSPPAAVAVVGAPRVRKGSRVGNTGTRAGMRSPPGGSRIGGGGLSGGSRLGDRSVASPVSSTPRSGGSGRRRAEEARRQRARFE